MSLSGLRGSLVEAEHNYRKCLLDGVDRVELGRSHRARAREPARGAVPLLGESVKDSVIDLTDAYEDFFSRFAKDRSGDDLATMIDRKQRTVDEEIEASLRSLPSA
jgi:hypothetical protein